MKLRDAFWVLFISMVPLIELRGAVPVGAVLDLPFYVNYTVAVIGNLIPVPFILLFIPKILDFLERFKLFRPIVQWLHKKADKNRGKIDKAAAKGAEPDGINDGAKADTPTYEAENSAKAGTPTYEAESGAKADTTTYEAESGAKADTTTCEAESGAKADTLPDEAYKREPAQSENSAALAQEAKSGATPKTRMSVGTFIALMLFVLIPAPGTGAWTGALVASLFGFGRLKSFAAIALGVLGCGVIMCLASYGVLGFLSFLV